jgi:SH3-like domain-containing protein
MRTFCKRLFFLCFLAAAALFFAFSAWAADFVSVTKDNVNVRTGPGTNHPVQLELFAGYPLKVVSREGNWLKVTDFENDTGWIEASLTRICDTVIVKSQKSINLRSEPNTGSSIVVNIDRGVVLNKIGMQDQWIHVRHNSGVSGWIFQNLIWP